MGNIFQIFTFCYLILYEQYALNEDSIYKEYDHNVYRKNLFQPTSYLNAGYGIMYEHVYELCIKMCIPITLLLA